jgi:hypothetical protein
MKKISKFFEKFNYVDVELAGLNVRQRDVFVVLRSLEERMQRLEAVLGNVLLGGRIDESRLVD